MKICILTQPLRTNYGGILQAYALQKILKDFGNDVITLNTPMPIIIPRISKLKRILAKLRWGSKISMHTSHPFKDIDINLKRFISENINYTKPVKLPILYRDIESFKFDVFIVGSDQTWRPVYSPYLPSFFLDFIEDKKEIKKISYAASFGTSDLEYTDEMLARYKPLLAKFNAISVREGSAVGLLKQYFGINNAIRVLDPTMLLQRSDYLKLIRSDELELFYRNPLRKENVVHIFWMMRTTKKRFSTIPQAY